MSHEEVPTATSSTFARLRNVWLQETGHLSSLHARIRHPAYQPIIELGPEVLLYILRELEQHPVQWTAALRAISRENPALPEDWGSLYNERVAWISWGITRGLL